MGIKIGITNDENNILVVKDFTELDANDTGLIGQAVIELEILKQELITLYEALE